MAKISQYPDGGAPQAGDYHIIARAGRNFKLLWSAIVAGISVTEFMLSFSDITTANANTTKHGLMAKLSGDASRYIGGDGLEHDLPITLNLFMNDTASGVGTYKTLTATRPVAAETSTGASITGAATLIKEFIAPAALFDFVSAQVLHVHVHAAKTAGTKDTQIYASIYHRTSGGTETLLGTSSVTGSLTGSSLPYDLNVSVPDTAFSSTDRLVVKFFGNQSGGGTNPTATLYYQGATDSRVEIGTSLSLAGYALISQLPVIESNTNDIFRVDNPGGNSTWTGTISGAPSGASVTVSAPTSGTEGVLVPVSTSQLAKMRLYNLTRGNSALIQNYNTGTNVVTLTANAPANWVNGDSLTIASQTVTGSGQPIIDLEITSGPTGKTALWLGMVITGGAAGERLTLHPFETFAASKYKNLFCQVATVLNEGARPIKITNNVFSIFWTGTPTVIVLREDGYIP